MPYPQILAMDVANAIPGCEAQHFQLEGNTILTGRVIGWGPSLHRTGLTWAFNKPADPTPETIAAALAPYVETQMRRIEQARALGLVGDRQPDNDQIAHIVSDSVLLENSPTLVKDMVKMIAKMVSNTISGKDTKHVWLALRIAEGIETDPRPRLQVDHFFEEMAYDGDSLFVARAIPDTLAIALTGRTLDEVVSIDGETSPRAAQVMRAIGHRVIRSTRAEAGAITLRFDGDWVPVA